MMSQTRNDEACPKKVLENDEKSLKVGERRTAESDENTISKKPLTH